MPPHDRPDSIVVLGAQVELLPVRSSNVEAIGYEPLGRLLVVRFKSGSAYVYRDVDESLWRGLLAAASKGQYLRKQVIEQTYPYERIR